MLHFHVFHPQIAVPVGDISADEVDGVGPAVELNPAFEVARQTVQPLQPPVEAGLKLRS